jgi:hypothetical protein
LQALKKHNVSRAFGTGKQGRTPFAVSHDRPRAQSFLHAPTALELAAQSAGILFCSACNRLNRKHE